MSEVSAEDIPPWMRLLAHESSQSGHELGTVARIDAAARRRAVASVSEFETVKIGRPLGPVSGVPGGEAATWTLRTWTVCTDDRITAFDHFEVDWHGLELTHIDGLNHFGVDGRWYQGRGPSPAVGVSVAELARPGIVTRAVFLDVPEARGYLPHDPAEPITAEDLEAALARTGVRLERGDALLIYMGRDLFEAQGARLRPIAESPGGRPGIGESGARWIADSGASLVAWDLMDVHAPGQRALTVHGLIWAIGLLLVDNCDFGPLRPRITAKRERTGLLALCPLEIVGASGCLVDPVVLV